MLRQALLDPMNSPRIAAPVSRYFNELRALESEILSTAWETGCLGGIKDKETGLKLTHTASSMLGLIRQAKVQISEAGDKTELICVHILAEIKQTCLDLAVKNGQSKRYCFFRSRQDSSTQFYERWQQRLVACKPLPLLTCREEPVFNQSTKIYRASGDLFISSNQKNLSFKGLLEAANLQPFHQEKTYIYVIGLDGKLTFAANATRSYHALIYNRMPCRGAGEIGLRKTLNGFELTQLNNKSGLYLPDASFLLPLKRWFAGQGIGTENTRTYDMRDQLIEQFTSMRLLAR